jgi:hypothetical protein
MAPKPKARSPTGKIAKPNEDQKAQSERFIETARRFGVDESGREFESALRKVAPPRISKAKRGRARSS